VEVQAIKSQVQTEEVAVEGLIEIAEVIGLEVSSPPRKPT
jgi:hypothetical protein